MASWMIHLRIADTLIEKFQLEQKQEFIMGNIAPDSGEPNEDWSVFTPSKDISHFHRRTPGGKKEIDDGEFIRRYFAKSLQASYSPQQQAFYLGYLTHLLTDKLWQRDIVHPAMEQVREQSSQEKSAFLQKIKDDWYDLDALYLKAHPDFRAFRLYQSCEGFRNNYLDFFSIEAFDNRRRYIVDFYRQNCQSVQERTMYITEEAFAIFVEHAAQEIFEDVRPWLLSKNA